MLGNLRENRVLSSGAYYVTGGCNKRGMADFGLSFARAACLRILPQWLSSFTVTLSIFTLAFVFSLNTINTARADVCFLPNAKGCEQVPYNEYLCTGDDCPEPEITCEASNNCYETEAAARSARDVKDSYYKNGDCWCLKDSCPSSIYNIADKGEGWNCSGQCTDEKSKNYGKYSLCSPKACSKGTTDCSASDCKICQNTDPEEYSGDYVCQIAVNVDPYCPDDYPLTEAPNGCYNETDKKCGEGKCYQSYNLKCDGEHQIVTGSGTACSCGCEAGYKMGNNGCECKDCFGCGADCMGYLIEDSANAGKYRLDFVGTGKVSYVSVWWRAYNQVTSINVGEGLTSIPSGTQYSNATVNSVFGDTKTLTTVTMPTVTAIGDYVFYKATALTSVDMPNVTSIGEGAFAYTALTSVDLPNVTSIGEEAFRYATALTSVNMPKVTSIGEYAFGGARLTSVDIPNVTSIATGAFGNTALTSVDLPNVTKIGISAFSGTPLTSVNMPNVTGIGDYAFSGTALTSVDMPNVTKIGNYAFNNITTSLTSVNMPNVTEIGDYAFAVAKALTSVNMPKVTSIGEDAFRYAQSLTRVDMPNVTKIGEDAFIATSKLTCVRMSSSAKMCSSGGCSAMSSSNFDKIFSGTSALKGKYSKKCSTSGGYLTCGDCEWGSN